MYCTEAEASGGGDGGTAVCYRTPIFLGLPMLLGVVGLSIATIQELKLRRKKTFFPMSSVLKCMGLEDWFRLALFLVTGLTPVVLFVVEHNKWEAGLEVPSHRFVDLALFNVLPWCLMSCGWLLHEVRRGSDEWLWLRLFTLFQVVGESLKLWSDVLHLEEDYDTEEHRKFVLISSIVVLALKSLAAFFMICFNRDWRRLREALRGANSTRHGLEEALITNASESMRLDAEEGEGPPLRRSESHTEGLSKLSRTPEQYAGLLSRLTFFWLEPLMTKGAQKELEQTDFYKLLRDDDVYSLSKDFSRVFEDVKVEEDLLAEKEAASKSTVTPDNSEYQALEEQSEGADQNGQAAESQTKSSEKKDDVAPGNLRLMVKTLHRAGVLSPFYQAAVFKLFYDTLLFISPQILRHLILFLTSEEDRPLSDGFFYVGLMFGCAVFQTFVLQLYFHKVFRTGMRVRSVLLTNVYRKALSLTPSARDGSSTGEVVNLMSTDCERLNSLFPYLHITWSAPYQLCLALVFLWQELQYAVLVAVFVIMCLMTPLTVMVTKKIKSIQQELMKVKDTRIRVTSEAITTVKVIKSSGWERTFRDKVNKAREAELRLLRKYLIWRAGARTMWTATPVLVSLATFATFVLLGGVLDAATAFTSLSLLNLLRFPLNVLPNIMNGAIEASVSLRRIANFLEAPELDVLGIQAKRTQVPRPAGVAVTVQKGNFFWDDKMRQQALRNINVNLKEGSVTVVTGQVGSGKSAFLSMLSGELQGDKDSVVGMYGTVALAAQVPWIQNATLRDNVLFGCAYDREWYNHVITCCALTTDLEQLADGDSTEIGERGINLSGGQKARVALARAVYSRADLVMLETVFEAVDEHVGAYLWKHCIQGILREPQPTTGRQRTVIVVTHALKYVHEADLVLVMKDGAVVEEGKYDDIVKDKSSELARLSVRVAEIEAKRHDAEEEEEHEHEHDAEGGAKDEASGPPELKRKASSFRKPENKAKGALIGKEDRVVGQVSWGVYNQYMQAIGGWGSVILVLLGLIMRTAMDTGTSAWLAYWSSKTKSSPHTDNNDSNISNATLLVEEFAHRVLAQVSHHTGATLYEQQGQPVDFSVAGTRILTADVDGEHGTSFYLGIYAFLSFSSLIIIGLVTMYIALTALTASRVMHDNMLTGVLRSPMAFFDTTPIGRILNRFSKDIYCIDEQLPDSLYSFMTTMFGVFGTLGTIATVQPYFLIVVPFMIIVYLRIQKFYIATSRQVKRWDSVLRSPIYSHFSESLDGVSTIRAYAASRRFAGINLKQLDNHLSAYYISVASNRWLAVRLEFIGTCLVLVTSSFVVMSRDSTIAAFGALAISYALGITQTLNWTVRMSSDVETNIVSVERIEEYTKLEPEAPEDCPDMSKVPALDQEWPNKGEIVFENVMARYRPGLELVLKGLTFTIPAGHKVGIVGRTGSGKSTILLTLLRIIEPCEGRVMIDGFNIQDFGLNRLRSGLSIIPQDPVMFSDTLRYNLDPQNAFTDEEIWRSLEITQLKDHVKSLIQTNDTDVTDPLLMQITEGGGNFSFGQRQLICIARAVLRRSRIIFLDEATSGIDSATDDLIQQTIRTEFKDSTVLTIAHRLTTIEDGDGIIVMDDGRVAEYDTPAALLKNKKSLFSKLVKQMNQKR